MLWGYTNAELAYGVADWKQFAINDVETEIRDNVFFLSLSYNSDPVLINLQRKSSTSLYTMYNISKKANEKFNFIY